MNLYDMIYKRKSFHLFRNTGDEKITTNELESIKKQFFLFEPLDKSIKVDIKIVKSEETNCKREEEYCILFYSEKKDNYLQNIGYIGEQLDLYLTSLNIGTLWFGIGKTNEQKYNDLDFAIMMAIKKVPRNSFRKDMFKSKRKEVIEIWKGNKYVDVANVVRFAPSACNLQPWYVEESLEGLNVYRYKDPEKRGIMPFDMVNYYNKIDIGIFLCFLELCLKEKNIKYDREIYVDNDDNLIDKKLNAVYLIK